MSDEHDRPSRPDETRQFSPFDDENAGDPSRTAAGPGGVAGRGAQEPDRTQQMDAADETAVTPRRGEPDATSVMPADSTTQDPRGGAWSGRAEVRPPRPGESEYTRTEWDMPPPDEPRGHWWMPILIGFLALVVLALLGWGIYLIAQATSGDENPGPTASATGTTTEPTTEATTTEPTTEPTTPETTEPTQPAEVTVPALRGLSREDAQQALDDKGLAYRLIFRTADAPADTVIDSDPAEGQEVPPDTEVTLVIAAERTTPATTATATPTDTTQQQPED
ncbi:PASTA domain-containing protein [Mangrovihabitans endophyticus]|uniref:PASTA domain-containing protein n=1 Tax=Mangrovihabitans endophyticus TaxID=1751298 RepID=A0A8J3BYQ7_9ACTN|nr:PASTA domain-containing protein [Mangrovihabitans endophyticus]GGK94667.1 hypothetical protein GCM10012284_30890 [Mangrovihabitans endophyticus]